MAESIDAAPWNAPAAPVEPPAAPVAPSKPLFGTFATPPAAPEPMEVEQQTAPSTPTVPRSWTYEEIMQYQEMKQEILDIYQHTIEEDVENLKKLDDIQLCVEYKFRRRYMNTMTDGTNDKMWWCLVRMLPCKQVMQARNLLLDD